MRSNPFEIHPLRVTESNGLVSIVKELLELPAPQRQGKGEKKAQGRKAS